MTKVSLVIQNHLNYAMLEVYNPQIMDEIQERLEFIKYLVHSFPDTTVKIDVDEVYKQFKLGHAK